MSPALEETSPFSKATPAIAFRSCLEEMRVSVDTITDGTVEIQTNELILSSAIMASTAHPRGPSINRSIPRSDLAASYFSSELLLKGLFGFHWSLLELLLIKSGRYFLWDNNSPTMATVTRMSRRRNFGKHYAVQQFFCQVPVR